MTATTVNAAAVNAMASAIMSGWHDYSDGDEIVYTVAYERTEETVDCCTPKLPPRADGIDDDAVYLTSDPVEESLQKEWCPPSCSRRVISSASIRAAWHQLASDEHLIGEYSGRPDEITEIRLLHHRGIWTVTAAFARRNPQTVDRYSHVADKTRKLRQWDTYGLSPWHPAAMLSVAVLKQEQMRLMESLEVQDNTLPEPRKSDEEIANGLREVAGQMRQVSQEAARGGSE